MKRLLFVAAIAIGMSGDRALGQAPATSAPRTIAVSGTAEIRVPPDEVNIRLGIETRNVKLDEAVRENETRIADVLKFLKEAGIDPKDVQTDFLQIQPQYNADRNAQHVTPEFYQVERNVGVRLRKVSQFDAVLAGAIRSGANNVFGVDFRTTELRKHRDAARQQAIRAAKEKATALAHELDAKVGRPQNITEETAGGWWSWPGRYSNAFSNALQNVAQAGAPGDGGEGNLAVGMIAVTATVHVTFTLE